MPCLQLAYAGNHPSTPTIVAYLRDAENSLQVLRGQVDVSKAPLAQLPPSASVGIDGMPGGGMAVQQDHFRGGVWSMPIARQVTMQWGSLWNLCGSGTQSQLADAFQCFSTRLKLEKLNFVCAGFRTRPLQP